MKIIGSSTTQMKRIIFMTMSVFYNVYRTCELNDVLEKDSFEIENNINNLMPVSYCSDKCEDSNNICNEKNKRKIVYSKDIMFNGGNRKYKRKCDLNDKKSLEVYNDETICNKSTSFQQTHNESNFLDSTENFDIFENIIEFCFADSNNINDSLTTMNVSNPANSYKLNIYDDENEDNSTEEKTIASENAKNKPDSFCLIEKRMKVFDTYLQDLKTQILIFFDSKISKNYKLFYVKRLDILNLAFKIIDTSDLKDIQKKTNFSLRDQHLIKSIKHLYINFKDVKSFDKKTSEKFSIKFDQLFMIKMNEIIEEKIVESSGYEKFFFMLKF